MVATELLREVHPGQLLEFGMVVLFSLIIGVEQGKIHSQDAGRPMFGTDRTFTFIGLLGYILYRVPDDNHVFFMGGGLILSALLLVFIIKRFRFPKSMALLPFC